MTIRDPYISSILMSSLSCVARFMVYIYCCADGAITVSPQMNAYAQKGELLYHELT